MQAYILIETNKSILHQYYRTLKYYQTIDFIYNILVDGDKIIVGHNEYPWIRWFNNQEKQIISIYDIHIERNLT